jgi:2-amino-4-hydroxy-6-hydroxymethyldihydropteridine diphosphokinase
VILVAIGANLPGPDGVTALDTCQAAARALAGLPGTRLDQISSWYETAPVPASDQPNYINGVVRLTRATPDASDPAALLAALQAIENRFGRRRAEANAARTLDLDLIDLDGVVRAAPDPILPHPRAHLRAFVLLPLLDVAPDWVHPVLGRTARALLSGTDQSGVRRLTGPIAASSTACRSPA